MSNLYERSNYLNTNYTLLKNVNIIEYDLKSANTSLCREYKLLNEKDIVRLENMDKHRRVIELGLMMRKDKILKEGLNKAFVDIRRRLFEANNLQDDNIHSIKKDAVFTRCELKITEFGHCTFIKKNNYIAYLLIDRLEIYYKRNLIGEEHIDVKGISDKELVKHNDYMLSFFKTLFRKMIYDDTKNLYKFMNKFMSDYKHRKLPPGYYREFRTESYFRCRGDMMTYDEYTYVPIQKHNDRIWSLVIDVNFTILTKILTQIL